MKQKKNKPSVNVSQEKHERGEVPKYPAEWRQQLKDKTKMSLLQYSQQIYSHCKFISLKGTYIN